MDITGNSTPLALIDCSQFTSLGSWSTSRCAVGGDGVQGFGDQQVEIVIVQPGEKRGWWNPQLT